MFEGRRLVGATRKGSRLLEPYQTRIRLTSVMGCRFSRSSQHLISIIVKCCDDLLRPPWKRDARPHDLPRLRTAALMPTQTTNAAIRPYSTLHMPSQVSASVGRTQNVFVGRSGSQHWRRRSTIAELRRYATDRGQPSWHDSPTGKGTGRCAGSLTLAIQAYNCLLASSVYSRLSSRQQFRPYRDVLVSPSQLITSSRQARTTDPDSPS
jgi:hypothetical protein